VLLAVSDTGHGMDDEVRRHLFEPFYTTKGSGSGLGLGLTISRDIVREFRGELIAVAQPGGGARFTVTLPGDRTPVPAGAGVRIAEEEST